MAFSKTTLLLVVACGVFSSAYAGNFIVDDDDNYKKSSTVQFIPTAPHVKTVVPSSVQFQGAQYHGRVQKVGVPVYDGGVKKVGVPVYDGGVRKVGVPVYDGGVRKVGVPVYDGGVRKVGYPQSQYIVQKPSSSSAQADASADCIGTGFPCAGKTFTKGTASKYGADSVSSSVGRIPGPNPYAKAKASASGPNSLTKTDSGVKVGPSGNSSSKSASEAHSG